MERDQGSIENHHKIMHPSAKHYFGVVWAHLGSFRAVQSHFLVISSIFGYFSKVWGAQASRGLEQLSCQPASPPRARIRRILWILEGFWRMLKENQRNPEDFKGFPMAGEDFPMAGEDISMAGEDFPMPERIFLWLERI